MEIVINKSESAKLISSADSHIIILNKKMFLRVLRMNSNSYKKEILADARVDLVEKALSFDKAFF